MIVFVTGMIDALLGTAGDVCSTPASGKTKHKSPAMTLRRMQHKQSQLLFLTEQGYELLGQTRTSD